MTQSLVATFKVYLIAMFGQWPHIHCSSYVWYVMAAAASILKPNSKCHSRRCPSMSEAFPSQVNHLQIRGTGCCRKAKWSVLPYKGLMVQHTMIHKVLNCISTLVKPIKPSNLNMNCRAWSIHALFQVCTRSSQSLLMTCKFCFTFQRVKSSVHGLLQNHASHEASGTETESAHSKNKVRMHL